MKYEDFFGKLTYDEYIKLQSIEIGKEREQQENQNLAKMELDTIKKILPDKESFILDVGCADGYMLDLLKKEGYKNIWGVELLKEKADIAISLGHNIVIENIENVVSGSNFNGIICSHMLEHAKNPVLALEKMKNLLYDDGIILLVVPVEHTLTRGGKHLHYWDNLNQLILDINESGLYVLSAYYKTGLQLEYWIICSRRFL
jgi:2-polyprenyl-3-methyl-5-hydroxy-6-metoxy-1,4-benzoquinol methylase